MFSTNSIREFAEKLTEGCDTGYIDEKTMDLICFGEKTLDIGEVEPDLDLLWKKAYTTGGKFINIVKFTTTSITIDGKEMFVLKTEKDYIKPDLILSLNDVSDKCSSNYFKSHFSKEKRNWNIDFLYPYNICSTPYTFFGCDCGEIKHHKWTGIVALNIDLHKILLRHSTKKFRFKLQQDGKNMIIWRGQIMTEQEGHYLF